MAERIVSMHAAYKSGKEIVDGFLSRPTERGSRTAIVLVHGYRGLDDGQKAVTRRFAQEGFVCLSPDLFHGRTFSTLDECALQKTSLDIPRAVEKAIDSVTYLRKLPWVGKNNVAVLGFCMGGGLALYAVAQSRAFAAAVIYYQSVFPDPEDLKVSLLRFCATTVRMTLGPRRRKSRCFAKLSINTRKSMKSKCTLERGMLF